MKTLPVLLIACLLFALAPIASASDPSCSYQAPREETLAHPTRAGAFLILDLEAPEKTGEWQDTNRKTGIQTEDCGSAPIKHYSKDVQSALLP